MTGNLYSEDAPLRWPGCDHLDCLPECRLVDGHCERLKRLSDEYKAFIVKHGVSWQSLYERQWPICIDPTGDERP